MSEPVHYNKDEKGYHDIKYCRLNCCVFFLTYMYLCVQINVSTGQYMFASSAGPPIESSR